ncbi:MAG TPA: efflux RND transporter periplasmic adaptor subunit [Pyrinomonadaceae bacterium]|jgi:RND family efflux transporter MFP subunit
MNRAHKNAVWPTLLLSLLAFAGCTAESKSRLKIGNEGASSDVTVAPAPVQVQVFEAQPAAAQGELVVPATVSVESTAVVLAQREGVLTKLDAQEGARVSKGQLIAVLGNDDQLNELQQAELEVKRLKVEEKQYDSLVQISRNELEREQALFREGVASKRDLERAQFRLDGAISELEKTRLATQTAQSKVEAVRREIEKGNVRAPLAGIVTRRHASLGSSVAKNEKLFEISQLEPLQVRFQLPQNERYSLGTGSLVRLTLPGSDAPIAQARVRRIDPVADAQSNTFGYVADVVGRIELIPGTTVNVHLPRLAGAQTFWIPRTAFPAGADLRTGATATILVVEDGRCTSRLVMVGVVEGEQVEITSGLAPGDRVIIAPPPNLKTGDTVTEG